MIWGGMYVCAFVCGLGGLHIYIDFHPSIHIQQYVPSHLHTQTSTHIHTYFFQTHRLPSIHPSTHFSFFSTHLEELRDFSWHQNPGHDDDDRHRGLPQRRGGLHIAVAVLGGLACHVCVSGYLYRVYMYMHAQSTHMTYE